MVRVFASLRLAPKKLALLRSAVKRTALLRLAPLRSASLRSDKTYMGSNHAKYQGIQERSGE